MGQVLRWVYASQPRWGRISCPQMGQRWWVLAESSLLFFWPKRQV